MNRIYAFIAIGGALGGVLRYASQGAAEALFGAGFPYGTLAVNIAGSFIIGLVAAVTAVEGRLFLEPAMRQGIMAGFCGGLTTFSFFSLQTLQMLNEGAFAAVSAYVAGTVIACLAAVWVGYGIGTRINVGGAA